MSDGQTLIAVFTLLYLVECLRLVPPSAWLAAGSARVRWTASRPRSRLRIVGGAPCLLPPLPPMQAYVASLPWPFIPQDDVLQAHLGDGVVVPIMWQELSPRVEESVLHLTVGVSLRFSSPMAAERGRMRLEEWRASAVEERRTSFLTYARRTLRTHAATRRARAAALRTRALRFVATIHFVGCFGVLSVLYHRFGDSMVVLAALGVLWALQGVQAYLFLRFSRRCRSPIPHRRWRALGIALLPQYAMRAADALLLPEVEPPHPLAWRDLLGDAVWLQHARHFWREARYFPGWMQNSALPLSAQALQTFFHRQKITEAEFDPPNSGQCPVCPRCGAEFQTGISLCKGCGGVELRPPECGVSR